MHGFAIPRPGRNYWREVPNSGHAALKSFTPQLFTICMGTGILSVLMYNNPYQFRGLQVIAVVFWLIDLVLFISICSIFVLRWIWFTKSTARMFESEVEQTTYLSTTTIAASTIVEMISLVCGSTWKNWQYASFAFWWATVLLALISATTTYWLLIRDEQVSIANLSPTLLYPTTGLLATASAGSVLVSYTTLSVRLAVPVVIVSYLLLGAGLFLCILTLSAYFLRLLHNQTPSPSKIGAQLIPVAALANAAYSFSSLGYVVGIKKHLFEDYPGGSGSLGDPMVGKGIYASGFLLGLTIWGFATFWLILAIVSFVRDVPKTNFNLNMWSAAYPLGIYGIASSQFATDLQSTAFSVVSSATLVIAVLYWAYLVIYTLPMVFTGSLFLHDAHEELEKEKRDRENASENSKMETAGQSDHFAGESRNASSGQIQETSDLPIARRSRTRQSDDTQV